MNEEQEIHNCGVCGRKDDSEHGFDCARCGDFLCRECSDPGRAGDEQLCYPCQREQLLSDCLATLQEIRRYANAKVEYPNLAKIAWSRVHEMTRLAIDQIEALEEAGVKVREDEA